MNKISQIVTTFFYVGYIKYAPGTIGSILSFPICYFILKLIMLEKIILPIYQHNEVTQLLASIALVFTVLILGLFVIGIWCSNVYIKYINKLDPAEIIIDEVVGQMIVIVLSLPIIVFFSHFWISKYLSTNSIFLIFNFILPLTLFRLFDIFKPWPINLIDEHIKNGLGVMLDDVVAAVMATVVLYAIALIVMN